MAIQTIIDGVDYTGVAQEGSVTHQHNRPSFHSVRFPMDVAPGGQPSRCKIVLDGSLDAHGSLVHIDDQGDEDNMYTTFTFADPTAIFEYRPARDGSASGDAGDFSKPSFMTRNTTAPQMLQEILTQSMTADGADGEGPMGISLGSFATGGVNLSGAPADWPMSIAQVVALLTETGELDVVNTPIDSGGNMGSVSAYNGDYGANLSGSVSFQYATGTFNARGCRRTVDAKELMNKLWIYLGPREGTKADPAGDQHWAANITRNASTPAALSSAIDSSRATYYTRMQIRIFDGDGASLLLELYKKWWNMESWLRLKPKTLIHITPNRGIKPAFRTGDTIHVAAGSKFRGGFSGTQRVMEYTYRWGTEGICELGEPITRPGQPAVVATADAEGAP